MEHVDLSYLVKIAGGNHQFVSAVINSFIEITPLYVQDVRHQCETKNWPGLQASAHRFKSAVKYLGMNKMAQIIETIEANATEAADQSRLLELIAAVNANYLAVITELKHILNNFDLQPQH
jgi:HPt (histidine-containing phosphotransfer) domain-containing protein